MNKDNLQLVPIVKAAQEFGVNRQTISNWHDAGLLQGTVIRGNRFVTRDSLDRLKDIYPEAAADAVQADAYRRDMAVLLDGLKERKDALRRERIYRSYAPRYVHNFIEKFVTLMRAMDIHYVEDEVLEDEFIRCWLFGHDIEETCRKSGVSYYSYLAYVKKYVKLLRRMESYGQMSVRNREMAEELARVKAENARLTADMQAYRDRFTEVNNEEDWKRRYPFLTKPIEKMDFTVRTTNILKMNDFDNLGQVIKHSRRDLLKLRHFGKKCLVEIEDFLESYGLELGMDLSINRDNYR